MIDGKRVEWAEDHWELFNPPEHVRALIEKRLREKILLGKIY